MKPTTNLITATFPTPYINSGYTSGARFDQAFDILEAGLAAGKIWNQEFLNAKSYVVGGCEHAQHIAAEPARDRELRSSIPSGDARHDIGYAFQPNQAAKLSRRLKKLSVTDSTPGIRSYIAVLDQIDAIWKYLQSFKAIIVKGRRPVEKTAEQIADEIANIGTCCICNRGQKLDAAQTMVHHGYQMSDYNHSGYRIGSCFGVKHMPYEFSCEANKLFLSQVLKPELKGLQSYLADLNASKHETLNVTTHKWEGHKQVAVVTAWAKGTKEYEQQRGFNISRTENEISSTKAYIAYHTDKVATWKLTPLADGTVKN